jgi:hypothetical protein
MHPFARARERIRAVNAAKMSRMFAKPFVGSLEGHIDAVEVIARKPDSLSTIASGSWDGGVCVRLYLSLERGSNLLQKLLCTTLRNEISLPAFPVHIKGRSPACVGQETEY